MANSSNELALTGNSLKRFVAVATLLSMIDQVRGESTTYSLDRHPHDEGLTRERLQKKFLDAFALICSTSREGAKTAAAVCMEEGHPSGTVLRVARNHGIDLEVVDKLNSILDDMAIVANQSSTVKEREDVVLRKIIELTRDKIRHLLQLLKNDEVTQSIERVLQEIRNNRQSVAAELGETFCRWINDLPAFAATDLEADACSLVRHIKWASHAKWEYSSHLEGLFVPEGRDEELPRWITAVYKIGRYAVAARILMQLAVKQPNLCVSMRVQTIDAPQTAKLNSGGEEFSLQAVIRRLTGGGHEDYAARLGQLWLSDTPEAHFKKACRTNLTVHGEMQLLAFYDHNPGLIPSLRFMGTSKKACFLCHKFLGIHPLNLRVSASHQKLYPSWNPAPCKDSRIYQNYKKIIRTISENMEQTVRYDLENRLGLRRPRGLDSSAGPSLPAPSSLDVNEWFDLLEITSEAGADSGGYSDAEL